VALHGHKRRQRAGPSQPSVARPRGSVGKNGGFPTPSSDRRGPPWPSRAGKYPILDYRALWSLGYKKQPTYTFPFWAAYCELTSALAKESAVTMRTLDGALRQYSKDKQG